MAGTNNRRGVGIESLDLAGKILLGLLIAGAVVATFAAAGLGGYCIGWGLRAISGA